MSFNENEVFVEMASEVIKSCAGEVYDDAIKDPLSETSKLLTRIPKAINAAFAPIDIWIAKKEYNLESTKKLLALKMQNIDEDKIVSPEPYVAVPAIQAISYSMDSDELRDLFANLLAASINLDTKDFVHPSFVEIIKQLDPDDAKLLKHFKDQGNYTIPKCKLRYQKLSEYNKDLLKKSITEGHDLLKSLLLYEGDPYKTMVCLDNLERLGLLETFDSHFITVEGVYEEFLEHPLYVKLSDIYSKATYQTVIYKKIDGYEVALVKGMINITNLGKMFMEICVL